jgi:DNA-binding transcriptional LysR family regulator
MNDINFSAIDLNLLRVFDALVEERSVTRAGERLGLTQSAISHALNRLRHVLHDELFVRGAEGMQPTVRASEIAPRLRHGLHQLQVAIAPAAFVPGETERRFTIACPDHVTGALMPRLMVRLRREAPRATLRVHPSNLGVAEPLDSGLVDVALGTFRRIPERFASEILFRDAMVWVVREDHPLAHGTVTLERLAEVPHLVLAGTADDAHAVDGFIVEHGLERQITRDDAGALHGALAVRGLHRTIGLTLPHSLAAPRVVAESDLAALLPRCLAVASAARFRLKLFEPPYPSPPIELRALWRRDQGDHPAIAWLRTLVREVAASARERAADSAIVPPEPRAAEQPRGAVSRNGRAARQPVTAD